MVLSDIKDLWTYYETSLVTHPIAMKRRLLMLLFIWLVIAITISQNITQEQQQTAAGVSIK